METSAKINEGVEEAFFTLARSVYALSDTLGDQTNSSLHRDIKTRLIDSQAEAAGAGSPGTGAAADSVKVNQPATQTAAGCC